jgi:hypothetical protein
VLCPSAEFVFARIIVTRHLDDNALTVAKMAAIPAGQQAWQTVTLSNGSATTTPGYMKDSLGFVHLKGQINLTGNVAMFTLPSGYRPGAYKEYGTSTAGAFGVIGISTGGVVSRIVGSNGNVDIDGVVFKAEA